MPQIAKRPRHSAAREEITSSRVMQRERRESLSPSEKHGVTVLSELAFAFMSKEDPIMSLETIAHAAASITNSMIESGMSTRQDMPDDLKEVAKKHNKLRDLCIVTVDIDFVDVDSGEDNFESSSYDVDVSDQATYDNNGFADAPDTITVDYTKLDVPDGFDVADDGDIELDVNNGSDGSFNARGTVYVRSVNETDDTNDNVSDDEDIVTDESVSGTTQSFTREITRTTKFYFTGRSQPVHSITETATFYGVGRSEDDAEWSPETHVFDELSSVPGRDEYVIVSGAEKHEVTADSDNVESHVVVEIPQDNDDNTRVTYDYRVAIAAGPLNTMSEPIKFTVNNGDELDSVLTAYVNENMDSMDVDRIDHDERVIHVKQRIQPIHSEDVDVTPRENTVDDNSVAALFGTSFTSPLSAGSATTVLSDDEINKLRVMHARVTTSACDYLSSLRRDAGLDKVVPVFVDEPGQLGDWLYDFSITKRVSVISSTRRIIDASQFEYESSQSLLKYNRPMTMSPEDIGKNVVDVLISHSKKNNVVNKMLSDNTRACTIGVVVNSIDEKTKTMSANVAVLLLK